MTISIGFYKKISKWLTAEETNDVLFNPLQLNGNPYKATVFLVNSASTPILHSSQDNLLLFANALVDRKLLKKNYAEQVRVANREYKGSVKFANWLQETHQQTSVLTSLNAYQVSEAKQLDEVKKQDPINYVRGMEIFDEVLQEFQPSILILQGKATVDQFLARYSNDLLIQHNGVTKIQDLEDFGPIASRKNADGSVTEIFATRSMAYFGKDDASFEKFKKHLKKSLKKR